MKAQFFNKPINYGLRVEGEEWEQGSSVKGDLTLSNTSSDTIDLTNLGCHLCYCQNKKLKSKDKTGIKVLASVHPKKGQESLNFDFLLDSDCPITDNTNSMQLLCGNIEDPLNSGMMELKIVPTNIITNFIEVFELFYRFKFKNLKNKKTFIECQVTPPPTNEWAKIQKCILQMKVVEEALIVNCLFKVKTLSFDHSVTNTKDENKEITLTISSKEHSLHGSVNQEGIKKHISKALEQVKLKPIL